MLVSLHGIAATKFPEMELEESEAKQLAEAIARVERHYPGMSAIMRGKVADHLALLAAVGSVYGTRFAAIGMRVKREREQAKEQAKQPPNNVAHFPQAQQ